MYRHDSPRGVLKLPVKVHGIKRIGYVVVNGHPRVDIETAQDVQWVVEQLRRQHFSHERFPRSWRVRAMMRMRPDTLANRILASRNVDKVTDAMGMS